MEIPDTGDQKKPGSRSSVVAIGVVVLLYLLLAYLAAPLFWDGYAKLHPAWEKAPRITHTGDHHPGDPINLALVGSQHEVKAALVKAGWVPADALSLKSSVEIAEASVLSREYANAPVSSLFLFGRKQDLAFEKPVGDNPRKRHHVRFWKYSRADESGREIWFGSATFDERVGLSHTTGQITHHIDGNVDVERDALLADLQNSDLVSEVKMVDDFQTQREGKNGGGDRWHTDGRLGVGVIRPAVRSKP